MSNEAKPIFSGWIAAGAWMLVAGILLGFGSMIIFNAAYWIIGIVWVKGWSEAQTPLFPLVVCTLCGIILALMAPSARESNEIRNNSQSLLVKLIKFLLPFAGGGPVGVAMGLIGLVKNGCSKIKKSVVSVCVRFGSIARNKDFSKRQKALLYPLGIIGGVLGVGVAVNFTGMWMMVPRLGATPFSLEAALTGAVLALGGWALGLLYLACVKLANLIKEKAGRIERLLPIACGVALGLSMGFLPHTGLPGSDEFSYQLLDTWQSIGPAALIATGLIRTALIAFLLNLGWSGGPFMPLVYSAFCFGFGFAGAFGLDASVCATAMATGVLVAFSGTPFMGAAVLICCPVESLPVIIAATAVAAILPRPKKLGSGLAAFRKKRTTDGL